MKCCCRFSYCKDVIFCAVPSKIVALFGFLIWFTDGADGCWFQLSFFPCMRFSAKAIIAFVFVKSHYRALTFISLPLIQAFHTIHVEGLILNIIRVLLTFHSYSRSISYHSCCRNGTVYDCLITSSNSLTVYVFVHELLLLFWCDSVFLCVQKSWSLWQVGHSPRRQALYEYSCNLSKCQRKTFWLWNNCE